MEDVIAEAARISFLSRRKYERYDLYYPGESFDNRLIKWLEHNFVKKDRNIAIDMVKCLKFLSEYELKELAIHTFENIKKIIMAELSEISYESCFSFLETRNIKFLEELGKCIFIAGVDDIEFDFFRRYAMRKHPKLFQKENFIEYYKVNEKTFSELPEHKRYFLLDQLSGSGTTALRYKAEPAEWSGKIPTFQNIWKDIIENKSVYYCPFILSQRAKMNLEERKKLFIIDNNKDFNIIPTCILPISPCLSNIHGTDIDEDKPVAKLCRKYYHLFEPDKHIQEGGSAEYGFNRAGLTFIIQSNCPNNTVPLIWHSFNDWFPLFPRVSHHKE